MGREFLQVLPILMVTLYALVVSVLLLWSGRGLPPANGFPAAQALLAVAMLGGALFSVVGRQALRIRELERRLREGSTPHADPDAGPDRGGIH
jgi:hypothetical protein